ncbi:PREDICTED: myosin light chain kinase, smooth muscle-like isoform X1 [Amphimedon queenslandica]|uniref:Uncharacterized protein n=1 Tax=Amphimedon queenslandica TaxID=400682 RepID=A0AAN0JDH6_AMPQE|nr:PREDICTED: myosin light chain kinase, smooth muscle-like isoform X1 [Amphimedon queenslandica]|eukprot:XP_019854768.1 PREDICTED: myosin light chain kinase, smooth muscle-like isoform X1 [Amphimedon queenslandica]
MSPVTKKRFLLETDTASDDVDGRSLMPPVDDLSRTSSAVVLETNDSFIRQDSVHSNYELLSGELGRGRFGIVRSCVSKVTGSAAAAKYLKESHDVLQEVKILRNLSSGPSPSPHVILFIDALITDENIVIITEVADGGQLIDYILRMYNSLNELLIVEYVKQLLSALDYIHERQIVHLDVKPENLLIASEVAPILKLTDFGSAQEVPYAGLSVRPDLIEFSSPEVVFDDNVTKCTDLWSTGVITYLLLSGVSPFFHEYPSVSSQRLSRAQYDLSLQLFHSTSPQAIDFISALLKKQPAERLTAASALEHQWIKSCTSDKQITDISLSRLTVFQARRKLQVQSKAVKTTVIFNPSQTRPQSIGNESDTADTIAESAPLFEGGTEEIQAPVGASVTIEWDYTGLPAPSVQWEHNERAVVPSRRVQMSTIQGVTRLSIVELVKADEGTYTCCILNSLGSDIRNCALIVIDKPAPPSSVSGVLLGSSTSVLVSWLPPINDGHSPILHYSLDTRLVDDTDWSLVQERIDGAAYVVDDLLPGKSYLFRVSSTNVIGTSQFSKPSSPILITNDDYSPPGSSPLVTDLQVRSSDFNLEYEIINEIGRGSFSVVYECTELTTDRPFAAKFIKCSNDDQFSVALREFEMIKNVTHPRIASLEDAFRSENHVILVLQYVPGGDLFNYITSSGPIDERQSARYIRHILEGLEYLHNRNILLINIAPENLVLGVGLQEVKIIDFSHSKYLHSNPQLEILPQQINYLCMCTSTCIFIYLFNSFKLAPEALQCSPLALSTDLWSVGAVALFMLSGQCPFVSDTRDQLINNIHTLNINYKINPIIQRLSLDCTNMIFDGLLLTNESKRLSSHQCQRHRWLQAGVSSTALVPQLQSMNTMEQVQYFMDKYPTHFHSNSDPI